MGFILLGDEKILINWDSEEQTIDLDTIESIKIHYSSTAGDYHLLAPLTVRSILKMEPTMLLLSKQYVIALNIMC